MVDTNSLTLRVLYTINSSPQYVLARSHAKVPVSIIDDSHASTSLKECLKTIRRSSPELLQDSNRDFSVYVLDPLESLASPSPISNSEGAASGKSVARGVAVSLGLMSWALTADDNENVAVTGTLTKSSAVQQLEVVFLLRETTAIPRSSFSETLPPRCPTPSFAVAPYPGAIPFSQPPAPVRSSSQRNPRDRHASQSNQTSHHEVSSTEPTRLQDTSFQHLLTALSTSGISGAGPESNRALQSVIEAIDSSGAGADGNIVLAQALKDLIAMAAVTKDYPNASTNTPATTASVTKHKKSDDEVVLLDKENVNPEVFRRRGAHEKGKENVHRTQYSHSGSKENRNLGAAPMTTMAGDNIRKRTLSQFMEDKEREQEANKAAQRLKVKGSDFNLTRPHRSKSVTVLGNATQRQRSLPQVPRPLLAASSPVRAPPPQQVPDQRPLWPRAPPPGAASSPPRPPRYIVPEWAKTKTATQPRFAMGEKDTNQKQPERNEDNKNAKKRSRREKNKVSKNASQADVLPSVQSQSKKDSTAGIRPRASLPVLQPEAVKASDSLPVFALTSTSSLACLPPEHPKTPPPSEDADLPSLFTPIAGTNVLVTPSPAANRIMVTSPLSTPTKKKFPTSPIVTKRTREKMNARPRFGNDSDERSSGPNAKEAEEIDLPPLNVLLEKQLDDSDCPPSSLPIASSNPSSPESSSSQDDSKDERTPTPSQSQLRLPDWPADLPPSSPPPPSSPALTPQETHEPVSDQTDDVTALDIEELLDFSSEAMSHFCQEETFTGSSEDFGALFWDATASQTPSLSFIDDSYNSSQHSETDVGAILSVLEGTGEPSGHSDAIADFDFSEFWESVKPLIELDALEAPPAVFGKDGVNDGLDWVDHTRLAEDVQGLFGGCLL